MYRLTCFGEVSIVGPDRRIIRLRSQKHIALLTYLAANRRRAHGRDDLASLFWDTPIDRARHSLSQALYDIRRRLDSEVVSSSPSKVRFAANHLTYDGHALEEAVKSERFAAAVELYEGGFAPGLDAVATGEFERWVEDERRRLDELARIALHKQIAQCNSAGRWSEMYFAATKLVRLDPLDESAHRAVIQALWLHGDQQGALRHYDDLTAMLRRELDATPDDDTTALIDRIRTSSAASTPAIASRRELPLVGRAEEFSALQRSATHAGRPDARLVYLDGEAGIGKTRLVREFSRSMELAGLRVLTSRCYSAESDAAYQPVLEGIRGVVAGVAASEEADGGRYHQLGNLFPEYPALVAREVQTTTDPKVGRRRMYEEVADVIRRSFGPPTIWIIEDIHWIDASSASLLHYLLRRLRRHPLMLVMTARRHIELTEAARKLLDDARSNLHCDEIALGPLELEEIGTLVRKANPSVDPEVITAVQRYSGGNPFYALEIARSLTETSQTGRLSASSPPITPRLRDLLALRIDGLNRGARRILESVAVLDRYAAPTRVAEMAGLELRDAADAAAPLYDRRLLIDNGIGLGFPHDIVREFVYNGLGSLKRTALHLRAGELLAGDVKTNPAIVARHFSLGGEIERAFTFAMKAAEASAARSAHEEAARMAELAETCALTDGDRAAALKILARARFALAHFDEAGRIVQWALTLAPDDPSSEKADYLLLAARSALVTRPAEARELLLGVDRLIVDISSSEERTLTELEVFHWKLRLAWEHSDRPWAREIASDIKTTIDSAYAHATLRPEARALALCSLAAYYTFFESSEEALELIEQATRFERYLKPEMRIRVLKLAGAINARLAHHQTAAHLTAEALALAKKLGDLSEIILLSNNIAATHLERGEFPVVHRLAREIMDEEASLPNGLLTSSAWIRINLANAHFYGGETAAADELVCDATRLAAKRGNRGQLAGLSALRGLLLLQRGHVEEARSVWQQLSEVDSPPGEPNRYKVEWLRAMVTHCCPRETRQRLRECAQEERPLEYSNYLKLRWLSELFARPGDQSPTVVSDRSSLLDELESASLSWFGRFSSRWVRRFACK